MISKTVLVQKFAKMALGDKHIIGYSVAGEETVLQVPELNTCFDIGRCPFFALTSDFICLSHGHMDHLAGIAYYLSQRCFQGMKAGTIFLPQELERGVDAMLRCWRDVERQGTPYKLIPMRPGELYEIRRDFGVRAFATHHGGPSLGYALINIREKLKPEYLGRSGEELAAMRKSGVQIQYRVEVPMVAFMGDTTGGSAFENPDVINAEILLTECTFFEPDHLAKAKAGKHMHLEQFAQIVPTLKNQYIVISHVSRRISVHKARRMMQKKLGPQRMENIHFLMDFEGAVDGGDIDQSAATLGENAE